MNRKEMFKRGSIDVSNNCNGRLQISITFENGTIWLTESEIAHLLGVHIQIVASNIRSIFKRREFNQCDVERYFNGVYFYNFKMLVALIFRANGGYIPLFRDWILQQLISQSTKRSHKTIFIQTYHKTTQN